MRFTTISLIFILILKLSKLSPIRESKFYGRTSISTLEVLNILYIYWEKIKKREIFGSLDGGWGLKRGKS